MYIVMTTTRTDRVNHIKTVSVYRDVGGRHFQLHYIERVVVSVVLQSWVQFLCKIVSLVVSYIT